MKNGLRGDWERYADQVGEQEIQGGADENGSYDDVGGRDSVEGDGGSIIDRAYANAMCY